MPVTTQPIRQYLQQFDLKRLFEELGWDRYAQPLDVPVDGQTFRLTGIAQKRGMAVFSCSPSDNGQVPDNAMRRKIERAVAKVVHEHLIIYVDSENTTQIWQWVKREPGKPVACREHRYHQGQSGDALLQKLEAIRFTLEEEERLSIVDVTGRMRSGFDIDRVTRRFYDRFKTEHTAFLKFIKGIQVETDREWYASVMLNRLMFVYFIQKKGFLDGDVNYLPNRLQMMRQQAGNDRFHSFYRHFLLRLFHEGLGQQFHSSELESLLGNVPYLNGGLFDVHKLEADYPDIQIPDEAFEKIFTFFDTYQWHLDERPLKNDNEINPDVLGYIFEKYINQKEKGAYYTKEDITGYIGQSTIIPFLFDAAHKECRIAFDSEQSVWWLLQADPDRYIYEAVKKGVASPLPPEIAAGLSDIAQRNHWNRTAPEEFALPTEIWREVVARRKRYEEIHRKLAAGEVHSIDDLITYNLDIRQFAQDVIENSEGPELLRAFYHAIEKVTVLDPTCGSGAFLFAALSILEPLYEACLDRMQVFVEELTLSGVKHHHEKYGDFRRVLAQVKRHPNRRYFILKSIIVNNLYGVDIMEEAVEICKLRLFLKLAAQVEQAGAIEPLPDIDFNIQAGNTLVGYSKRDEVSKAVNRGTAKQTGLVFTEDSDRMARIDESAEIADRAFQRFHQMQTEHEMDPKKFADAKAELRRRLDTLTSELDRYLAAEYGIDRNNIPNTREREERFRQWKITHQPFHWYAEFYGIMKNGGFDVIIGNPPWKEYAKVKPVYTVRNYATEKCGNLHGFCTERALNLRSPSGASSFIVQLPLTNSSRMTSVRRILQEKSGLILVASFDDRPGKLFEGLQHCRSVIFISRSSRTNDSPVLFTTRYQRWPTVARPDLFTQLEFTRILSQPIYSDHFPKYATAGEESLFQKVKSVGKQPLSRLSSRSRIIHFIFYQEATQYWVKASVGLPYYAKNGVVGPPAHGRYLYFDDQDTVNAASALLNSSLFYAYFIAYGDCFHLTDGLVSDFPVAPDLLRDASMIELGSRLMQDLRSNAREISIKTKDGDTITYAEFYALKSKPIIDEIDCVLAQHYGFTDEELDFIINYDIKYRMGRDAGGPEAE